MGTIQINRRQHERVALQPMYTSVSVQRISDGRMTEVSGHAYDISEGGIRIELEERLAQGEHINLSVMLPGAADGAKECAIHLACEVVWINDELDDPAMPRMACRIHRYLNDESRERMLRFLGSRPAVRAA